MFLVVVVSMFWLVLNWFFSELMFFWPGQLLGWFWDLVPWAIAVVGLGFLAWCLGTPDP